MIDDLDKHYCLPKNYKVNPVATTRDSERTAVYWNSRRLRNAFYYQYPVYLHCEKIIEKRGVTRLIDVGCGVGRKLLGMHQRFPDVLISGIDQENPIQYCREHYDFGNWLIDDLENPGPELKDIQAELVICADVIEHAKDPDLILDYLRARCEVGGQIVLSTPDRESLYGANKMESGQRDHVREWSFTEFFMYLESRGFCVLEHFLAAPTKVGFNTLCVREWFKQVPKGNRYRYCQVCVVTPK